MLNGLYTNIEFVQEQITRYGLSLDLKQPLLLVQSFCEEKNEDFVQATDARRLLFERLSNRFCAIFLHGNCCILLGQASYVDTICVAIKSIFEECPSLYWGVMEGFSNILECKDMITALRQIPQQHFYQPKQKLFFYRPDLVYTIPDQIDFALIESTIHQSDYQKLMFALGEFLNQCSVQNASPYTVRKNCEHAIYVLMFALEKAGEKTVCWNQKKIEYFQKIEKAVSIDELCDVLDDILSDITSWNTISVESNGALLYQIDTYIAENYMKPIHLSDLSSNVHLSYHYLSRILKNSYGKNFNELLNHVRIEASQKLLLSTDMTLSEVAEAVGFSDQSYWGKVFKKQTGLSPRLYRLKGMCERTPSRTGEDKDVLF